MLRVRLSPRVFTPSANRERSGIATEVPPRVLAVTADLSFYARVLNAASSTRWRADWARTLTRAMSYAGQITAIVIYDSNLPGTEWGLGIRPIVRRSRSPAILLRLFR